MLKKNILIFSIFLTLATFSSCNKKTNNEQKEIVLPSNIENQIKYYQEQAHSHYNANPDSSEYYFNCILNLLDSTGFYEVKLNFYIHLCELYQYRKPDYQKAMLHLSNAIRILIQYADFYKINAFLLINIGNQFYNFGFYEQAIDLYKVSAEIDEERNIEHARVTAYHNISLAYKNMALLDSAVYYLELARQKIPVANDLKYALNDVYHAEIRFMKNEIDSVLPHLKQSLFILNKNEKNENFHSSDTIGLTYIYLHEITSNTYRLLSKYYDEQGQDKAADFYFNKALEHAYKANSKKLIANLYFNKVLQCSEIKDDNCLKQHLDSADTYVFLVCDLNLQKTFADSMVNCLNNRNLNTLQNKYIQISSLLKDSIASQKSSFELQQNLMLLASVIAEHTAHKQLLEKEKKIEVIRYQNIIIIIVFTLLTIIIIAFIKIFLQNRHLNSIYRAMVSQVKKNIRTTTSENVHFSENPAYERFEKELELFMEADKPYLNKNITLNDLSSMLNTNQTYLSNYINTKYSINFNDFINKYRVNESCKLLLDDNKGNLSIENIAEKSGFNSKSTFYAAFKKLIGMSPAVFIKNNSGV